MRANGCFRRNENRWLCPPIRTPCRLDLTPILADVWLMRGNNPLRVLIVMRGTVGFGFGVGLVFDGVVGFGFGAGVVGAGVVGCCFAGGEVAVALFVPCGPFLFPCMELLPCAKPPCENANHPPTTNAMTVLAANCPLSPATAPPSIYFIRQFCKDIYLFFDVRHINQVTLSCLF